MYSGMDTAADQAASDALNTLNGIAGSLETSGFDTAGGEAGQGYAQGLQTSDTSGAAGTLVTNTENAVRSAQASGSPAAAFMPMGAEAAQGYGMGLQQQDVSGYASAFIAAVGAALTASAQIITLLPQGINIMQTLTTGMNGGRGAALASARATGSGIRSAFAGVNLTSTGSNIIRGLLNGMNSMFSTLLSRARQMASQLKQTIQSGMQVASPSKFTTWVGEMTGQGLVEGLEGATKNVTAAAAAMALGVTSAFSPVALAAPEAAPQAIVQQYSAAAPAASVSPYEGLSGNSSDFSGSTNDRHIVLDIRGGGSITLNGLTKEQAIELIYEKLKPALQDILVEEITTGGDSTYDY